MKCSTCIAPADTFCEICGEYSCKACYIDNHHHTDELVTLASVVKAADVRDAILGLQEQLMELPQEQYPVRHYFAPGQYAREIFIPAHNIVVGKIHKHAHINTLSLGDCIVVTEFGIKRLRAPISFVSEPGTKRALITRLDTIWTTYHVTDKQSEKELPAIEDELIAKDYGEYDELAFKRNMELAQKAMLEIIQKEDERGQG